MDLGPHALTIWMCYGAVALVVGCLILWLQLDGRRVARQLASLEERGVRRRSAGQPEPEPNTRV